jgi:hypothetical protein
MKGCRQVLWGEFKKKTKYAENGVPIYNMPRTKCASIHLCLAERVVVDATYFARTDNSKMVWIVES